MRPVRRVAELGSLGVIHHETRIMDQTIRKRRSEWGRRWMTLIVCVGISLLLASISVTGGGESRWSVIVRAVLAVAALICGIYEFVRPDNRKPDA